MDNSNVKKCTVEPIRGSVYILAVKFVLLVVIFNGLYEVAYFLLNLGFPLPFDLHHHLAIAFLIIFLLNIIFQVYTILLVVLQWANNVYYITDNELVERQGTLSIREKVYKFETVRSMSVERPFFGKIFGYGNIVLSVTGKDGEKELEISGIGDPYKYEKMLRECCKKLVVNGQERENE